MTATPTSYFAPRIRRLGDRQLAEEVVQDTWLTLWDRAELFDPAMGSVVAWLSTIARNRAVDRLRSLARRPGALPLSAVFATDTGDDRALSAGQVLVSDDQTRDPQVVLDELELRDTMLQALGQIPHRRAPRPGARLLRRPDPTGDRAAAGLAAGHRQDPHAPGAAAVCEACWHDPSVRTWRSRHPTRPRSQRWWRRPMDHAEVRSRIADAVAGPGGLTSLVADPSPEAAAVRAHVQGCAECAAEWRAWSVVSMGLAAAAPDELTMRPAAREQILRCHPGPTTCARERCRTGYSQRPRTGDPDPCDTGHVRRPQRGRATDATQRHGRDGQSTLSRARRPRRAHGGHVRRHGARGPPGSRGAQQRVVVPLGIPGRRRGGPAVRGRRRLRPAAGPRRRWWG